MLKEYFVQQMWCLGLNEFYQGGKEVWQRSIHELYADEVRSLKKELVKFN